jgi:hypothetical protein
MPPTDLTAISVPFNGKAGFLILGESAYTDDEGYVPDHTHTLDHPPDVIERWGQKGVSRFDRCVMRAVANAYDPTTDQMKEAWRKFGIANFIGPSTPTGSKRPTKAQWVASRAAFRPWINKWKPSHILVLGIGPKTFNSTYDWLPENPELEHDYYLVAYRLDDGAFTICHGIPHPRVCGWERVREGIDELSRWAVVGGKLRRHRG